MKDKKSAVKNPKPLTPKPPVKPEPKAPQPPEIKPTEPKLEPPKPEKKPLTLNYLNEQLEFLKKLVSDHSQLIAQLQETLAKKRRPVASNGKVQIKDKQTGQVYPSKNNAYQSLLKAGELKDLVDKGLFGDVPEKNTFGWYVLAREWPDRFEEVHPTPEQTQQ